MTHFRGQIRGPHWGPAMDNMLIDFWREHDCLFNSSIDSYHDKDLKTRLWSDFAMSIGKPVSDVERRSRSLRTQYGRVLWHPERVSTVQQKMLREKLDFLKPYIVRRRGDSYLEETFDDREEDDEEPETEGSMDQEMGSSFGSPDMTGHDLDDEPRAVASNPNPAPLHCPNPQPRVTGCPRSHADEGSTDQPDRTAAPNAPERDVLNHFAEVMLADMRQVKDPVALMRLRRDVTDLVFKAVEEDVQRRCVRGPPAPALGKSVAPHGCSGPRQACSRTSRTWRQRFLKRKDKGCEAGRRTQRWEGVKHMRRGHLSQPVRQGRAAGGMSESGSPVIVQPSEMKREAEAHVVKTEEETLQLA